MAGICFIIHRSQDLSTYQVAVAVKTLKVGSTVEEKLDFLSEAEMMKRFNHKNIVRLLGVCTRTEPVYTVMEFILYGRILIPIILRLLFSLKKKYQ